MSSVVVSGALANKPANGGEAWVRMTWVAGLRRMGFDVWFIEQIARELMTDRHGRPVPPEESLPVTFFRDVTRRFGLEGRSALLDESGAPIVGAEQAVLEDLASDAGVLVNISGHLRLQPMLDRFRCKAYIDLDPGFTQFWHAAGMLGDSVEGHDHFFSVGLNIGDPGCAVPTDGIPWRPLPPPVVLDDWPVGGDPALEAFTTVASWRGAFGPIEHGGHTFGLKAHEFRRFIELPAYVQQPFEIALEIHPADGRDRAALQQHGWRIVDPRQVVPDPDSYRDYIQGSGAEFSVAQGIYVETGSGWFSDRTVRYLASGRPALVQDTGVSDHLPVGQGLVTFRSMAEAIAGAEHIADDYHSHCRAARTLAEQYFASDVVLSRFVDDVGVIPR